MRSSHSAARRCGPTGEAANELESVLTGILASADVLADDDFGDDWTLQRELGALDEALTRALKLVRRIAALAPTQPSVTTGARAPDPEARAAAALAAVGGFDLDARWDT